MPVDAGDGVVYQLLVAGVDLTMVEHVAIIHTRRGKNLGYTAFIRGSWNLGRRTLNVVRLAKRARLRNSTGCHGSVRSRWQSDLCVPPPASSMAMQSSVLRQSAAGLFSFQR